MTELSAHPMVGEARSLGLIGAVEIVSEKGTNARFGGKEGNTGPMVRDRCIEKGLMVRAVRDSLVLSPPLTINHQEIDAMFRILEHELYADEAALVPRERAPDPAQEDQRGAGACTVPWLAEECWLIAYR